MDVVIMGAGGHGRVVLDALRLAGTHRAIGFLDADTTRAGDEVMGIPILGGVNLFGKLRKQGIGGVIVAIGDNRVRGGYAEAVEQAGFELLTVIHPAAILAPGTHVGRNVFVAAGAIISTGVRIADGAIINTGAVVDHECQIGRFVHICPGALVAGRVEVEERAFVGMGAKVLPCLRIGAEATIGAGAVVLQDVSPRSTVVGVPARAIQSGSDPAGTGRRTVERGIR